MEQGKIVKGNNLIRFLKSNKRFTLWSFDDEIQFEVQLELSEVENDKWYYVTRHESSPELYLVEIDFIGSDDELNELLN